MGIDESQILGSWHWNAPFIKAIETIYIYTIAYL